MRPLKTLDVSKDKKHKDIVNLVDINLILYYNYTYKYLGAYMKYLLQVDFPHSGPFKEEFTEAFTDLAKDIANEEGLIWKIWTENEETKEGGGIYLFGNLADAKRYLDKHTKRLESFGYTNIRAKIFHVNEALSVIDGAPL